MLNLLLLLVLWSVILAPVYVEWRRERGVRRDARSLSRFAAALNAMAPAEARKALRR